MAAPVAEEREGGRRRFLLADDLNAAAAAASLCHIGKQLCVPERRERERKKRNEEKYR